MNKQKFTIPSSSEKYIAMQRTFSKSKISSLFKRLGLSGFYNKFLCSAIEGLRTGRIEREYFEDVKQDYLDIKEFLPENASNILDIGSGMAGIDVFIFNHYKESEPEIFLLDKQGESDRIYYNFESNAAYYNSFRLARELLKLNGVPEKKINTININEEGFPQKKKFDLITSFLSWGFHYPISTYIENVGKSLSQNGKLILDVRRGSGGKEELSREFNNMQVINDNQKYLRLACYN